jgi:hypothetical protein
VGQDLNEKERTLEKLKEEQKKCQKKVRINKER